MSAINKAITNMRRTPYQALAAILVLTVTFFVGIVISFATVGVYQALTYFETRPQVLIFFDPETPASQIQALQDKLALNSAVTDLTYIPQQEALNIYRDLNKNDPVLLELVTADILPASLEVSTTDIDSLKKVAQDSTNEQGVDEVVFRSDVVDLLNKWLNGLKLAGVIFIGIMALTSVLIIGIVVGMKISGKNYEIKVLRLIGASSWYIQAPFLFEGALYGIVSSIFAFVGAITVLLYSTPIILQFAGEVPILPTQTYPLAIILVGSLSLGLIIGTFGSFIAVKRFLKL